MWVQYSCTRKNVGQGQPIVFHAAYVFKMGVVGFINNKNYNRNELKNS